MSTPELDHLRWRRSSFSDNGAGNCVEIALVGESAAIRDSKSRRGGVLMINQRGWEGLRSAVR